MSQATFSKIVKSKIINYWETKLREEALELTSIPYFKPNFMSLTEPHPIWSACGSSPFECHKAVIAARMLSGRYLTDSLQGHWTQNKEGVCLLPACASSKVYGNLEHLILFCPSLSQTRQKLLSLVNKISMEHESLQYILQESFHTNDYRDQMQLLLDCTSIPSVIYLTQMFGPSLQDRLLYLGRTWCYCIHHDRMNQLGLLKFR